LALTFAFVLFEQQVAELLFEPVDGIEGGPLGEIGHEPQLLFRFEVMAMAAHERQQSPVLRAHRIDLSPAGQEVVVDETDHMEAVGHDYGLGEVFPDQAAVNGGQVHADDPHQLLALQAQAIGLQRRFRAAQRDIVDAVILQVAEGSGVTACGG